MLHSETRAARCLGGATILLFTHVLAACGSAVEREPGAGGGDAGGGTPSSTSTATSSGGDGGCGPYERACNCAECDGTCVQECNYSPEWSCHTPGPPGDDEFACGGYVNCGAPNQACIHVAPAGDGCDDYFCADVPYACEGDATCDCLAPYVDEQIFDAECTERDGTERPGVEIRLTGTSARPPWDHPACGLETCLIEENESCWLCISDGGATETDACSWGRPDVPVGVTCTIVWGANG